MSQMTATTGLPARTASRRSAPARLRVVAAAPARTQGVGFGVLCIVLLVTGLMAVLVLNTARAEGSFALQRLQATATELRETQVGLEADLAAARAPESLAQEATSLGMVPSESTAFIRLSDGSVTGVAVEATEDESFTVVSSATPRRFFPAELAKSGASTATEASSTGENE